MNIYDPIFPYKNLFITARPGMGASTLVANIVNKYLDQGKKCLVFDSETRAFSSHIDRSKVIREKTTIDKIRAFYLLEEYGNLTVTYCPIIHKETLLDVIEKKDYDVIIYEDPVCGFSEFKYQTKELAELTKELREREKIFIFVTHLKRSRIPFMRIERNTLSNSRHRKAIPCFDASAIVYRNGYYEDMGEIDKDIEEIRLYERDRKKYRTVSVDFDFPHQSVKLK